MPFSDPTPKRGDSEQVLLRKLLQIVQAKHPGAGTVPFSDASPKDGDSEQVLLRKFLQTLESQPLGGGGTISADLIPKLGDPETTLIRKLIGIIGVDSDTVPVPPAPPVPSVPTLYHLVIMGQSNGKGYNAALGIDTTISDSGRMFVGGIIPGSGAQLNSIVPLQESVANAGGQTIAQTLANHLASRLSELALVLVSDVAVDASGISGIKKPQGPYTNAIAQVTQGVLRAAELGLEYRLLGVCLVHGETDDALNTATYEADIVQLQSDFETDANAITGVTGDLPMYLCQQAWYGVNENSRTAPNFDYATPLAMLAATQAHPTKFHLVGPRYNCDYADIAHLSAAARREHGERYARAVYRRHFNSDNTDFRPLTAVRTGNVIDVVFQVPTPPLTWDFKSVQWQLNYGFEFYDTDASATVSSVAILSANTVRITLSGVPTGITQKVFYAATRAAARSARFAGGRGNLCDSESSPSQRGYKTMNFCPVFTIPVT